MNLEPLVCRARQGDVKAFVELAHGFQHLAFGSALALVRDLQQAEDVVQEAFLAAWSALPKLAEPAAFPAWLRGIVRHQAHRVLRRRHLEAAPLEEASEVVSEEPHGLPDDFADRIGRLVAARSELVEAVFDPAALPDLLSELLVSDEANKRAVSVQVVQRTGGGAVLGIAATGLDAVPRGATVLNTEQQTPTAVYEIGFARIAPLLAGDRVTTGAAQNKLIETGIKVIDVMCPLVSGGRVALVGEYGAGLTVLMEELVRRLSGGPDPVSLFVLMPPFSSEWPGSTQLPFSISDSLKREGYSEGTAGAVQTFFLRGQEQPWTAERLQEFASADAVIHLSREVAKANIYPAIDLRTSRSRLLETAVLDEPHRAVAARVRSVLGTAAGDRPEGVGSPMMVERARKLQNYFTQPFFVAEPYTRRPGTHVGVTEALCTCRDILEGRYDEVPENAFYFAGGIEEIRKRHNLEK